MNVNKRYRFRDIFWVITLVYLFIFLFGLIALTLLASINKEIDASISFRWKNLLNEGISLCFFSIFLFFTLNAFYRRIANREKFYQFLKPILIGLLAQGSYHSLMFFVFERDNVIFSVNDIKTRKEIPISVITLSYLITASFCIGVSLLVAYLTYLRDERQLNRTLKEQKIQLEIEKTQANYNFLKAQINPHFLHNTLSFLYVKSLSNAPELPEGILTLSDIMRYALSEGNAKNGKAPLKDEIAHLRNVIKINQLRFSNNLNVQLEVEGIINGAQIVPFVLITLVENAFKHGDLKSTKYPIVFKIRIEENNFFFYSHNKKNTGPKELSTGIGLDNIKKRLDLVYGNNYQLRVQDEAEFYSTELIINPL